jgi:cell wall-associated NlpC family hydrolase
LFNLKKIDTVQMVKMAKTLVGVSYLWGGKSPKAIDCSGLTSLLYFFQGIILQRDASQQIKNGELISDALKVKNLKTGDLLFFGKHATDSLPERASHVAFYIGNGKIIHASGLVKISSLYKEEPDFETRYLNAFLKARRIVNSVGQPGIQRINDNELYKFFIK